MPRIPTFALVLTTLLLVSAAHAQVSFLEAVDVAVGDGSQSMELTAIGQGDFDGDGDVDLVVTSTKLGLLSDPVITLVNDGQGAFAIGATADVRVRPSAVAVEDLNGDGALDLAVALLGSGQVAVLLGDGAGDFGAAARYDVCAGVLVCAPVHIVAGEIDGENGPDLVIANEEEHTLTVLLNDGDADATYGTEINIDVHVDLGAAPLDSGPNGIAVADLNGDGHSDIVVALKLRNRVGVLLNDGTGDFPAMETVEVGEDPVDVEAALLDDDSNIDLVVANLVDNNVSVLLGDGLGAFTAGGIFDAGNNPADVALADMDGDGNLDVVTANREGDNVSVLLGNGDGTFGDPSDFATGGAPVQVAVADLNGDSLLDLATANQEGDLVDQDDISVLLGREPADGAIDGLPDELIDCGAGTCGPVGAASMLLSLLGLVGAKRTCRRRWR